MDRKKKLLQEKADLAKESRETIELAEKDDRGFTEDEKTRAAEITARVESIDADLAIIARNDELQRGLTPAEGVQAVIRVEDPPVDPMGGYQSLGEFAREVHRAVAIAQGRGSGEIPKKLVALYNQPTGPLAAPTNFHQEGGSAEGYMVPPAMRDQIWELIFADDDLVSMVDSEPVEGNSSILIADESTPWGATGVQANWRSEGVQLNASKLDTDPRTVVAHELVCFVLATGELLQDTARLTSRLMRRAPEAIRWKASDAIIYGTGAGQPLGYFESGALVSVAKETSQIAATLVTENIAKMYSRMLGHALAHWEANADVIPQLMTMVIANQPIWTPPNAGFANAPGGFLLGRPIRITEHAKTLGAKGDIQFINPRGYYAITKRSGLQFDSSIHLFFDYNIQAFRWIFRFGGQPFLSAPVTPANGSSTKSHFVVLDERA